MDSIQITGFDIRTAAAAAESLPNYDEMKHNPLAIAIKKRYKNFSHFTPDLEAVFKQQKIDKDTGEVDYIVRYYELDYYSETRLKKHISKEKTGLQGLFVELTHLRTDNPIKKSLTKGVR